MNDRITVIDVKSGKCNAMQFCGQLNIFKWSLRLGTLGTQFCLRLLTFRQPIIWSRAFFPRVVHDKSRNIPFFFLFFLSLFQQNVRTYFLVCSLSFLLKKNWRERERERKGTIVVLELEIVFTGEYILNSGNQEGDGNNAIEEDDRLLREASLDLDNHPLAGLTDDSLGLTDTLELENDLPSDLLGGSLLASANVESLLNNDSLDLPDGFNLEEALQLVGLDEAQSEVCPDLYLPTFYSFLSATFICMYIHIFFPSSIVERMLRKRISRNANIEIIIILRRMEWNWIISITLELSRTLSLSLSFFETTE